VIICKECQHAVLPDYIDAHFAAKPQHGLEKDERRRIAEEVVQINGLIGNEETLRQCEFPFPPPTSKLITALAQPMKDYIQCTLDIANELCLYICGTIERMQKHCKEEHGWKNKNKRGR
jgi:Orsellinic acid/F9775 biosynthesis cluster protein D